MEDGFKGTWSGGTHKILTPPWGFGFGVVELFFCGSSRVSQFVGKSLGFEASEPDRKTVFCFAFWGGQDGSGEP